NGLDGAMLITFMILVMRLLPPLKQLFGTPATAQQSLASAERLFEVLDQPTELTRDSGTRRLASLQDGITFEKVSFAYDAEAVLEDISFRAPKGRVIAL